MENYPPIPKPMFHILYEDKLLRYGRSRDLEPVRFDTQEEAEMFILNHRSDLIERNIPARRTAYYVFVTQTDLGTTQWG